MPTISTMRTGNGMGIRSSGRRNDSADRSAAHFRLFPEGIHLLERRGTDVPSPLTEPLLDVLKTADELPDGPPESVFGVESNRAGIVHQGEQQIAELSVNLLGHSPARCALKLVELFLHFF